MHCANNRFHLKTGSIAFLVGISLLVACTNSFSNQGIITPSPSATFSQPSLSSKLPVIPNTQIYTDSPTLPPNITPHPTSILESPATPEETLTVLPNSPTIPASIDWMNLPVIPTVSQTARSIYLRGIEMGNDPHSFSKIGDCQSISTYFLSYFDMPGLYNLGDYAPLQKTIDWYSGSFSRDSLAVKGGFNAAAILSPLRADPKQCKPNENPIMCEFRLHNPSIAIISLEEWWAGHPENYESYLRQIIEYSIDQGVVPIIATKADNLEGNYLINQTIAKLAQEYDIPLWNFWAAIQSLPNHGLIAVDSSGAVDMFHLTHSEGYYFYNDLAATQSGWSIRNLTALQALNAVKRGLTNQP